MGCGDQHREKSVIVIVRLYLESLPSFWKMRQRVGVRQRDRESQKERQKERENQGESKREGEPGRVRKRGRARERQWQSAFCGTESPLPSHQPSPLWFRRAMNPDVSIGPLSCLFTRLLAPLTHSLALHYLLCSCAPLRPFVCLLPSSWGIEWLDVSN